MKDLKILSRDVLIILYQLIESVRIDVLDDNAEKVLAQKRLLLSSVVEALKEVHDIQAQVSPAPSGVSESQNGQRANTGA